MSRLEPRITTQLPAKIFFVSGGVVIEELAVIRNLSPGGVLFDLLSPRHKPELQENRTLYVQLRLSGNAILDLVGEIVRNGPEGTGLRFLFLTRQIKSAIWDYVKPRLPRSSSCNFCGQPRRMELQKCPACGLSLNFDDPQFFDIHEKETFLGHVRTRTRDLDTGRLIELLNSIDSELVKSRHSASRNLPADSIGHPEHEGKKTTSPLNGGGREAQNKIMRNPDLELFANSRHHAMAQVTLLISKAAGTRVPVLILGESGTGKELTARAIHAASPRREQPFIPINCAAIPESLLESELFGYAKGAFTGAVKDKKGLLECAENGTLFLDEIGEMLPALQAKLLRVLQNGEYCRIGSTEIRYCDVRVLAATNVDLKQRIETGAFRQDLYYRMNIIEIELPPLRERRADILVLADEFVRKFGEQYHKPEVRVSREAAALLNGYRFPGNIRELENIMHRAVIMCDTGTVEPFHLSKQLTSLQAAGTPEAEEQTFREAKQLAIENFERQFIVDRLQASHGNITAAANASGIDIKNFHTKMTRYGIDAREFKTH